MLLHMLPNLASRAVAWETMKSESTSFVDTEFDPHHTDLLFSVQVADGPTPTFIYFLLEHQSTSDHDMPFRMLVYLTRIWKRDRKQRRKEHRRLRSGPLPLIIAVVRLDAVRNLTADRCRSSPRPQPRNWAARADNRGRPRRDHRSACSNR